MRSTLGLALLVSVAACGDVTVHVTIQPTEDAGVRDAQVSSDDDAEASAGHADAGQSSGEGSEMDAATSQPDAAGDGGAGTGDGGTDGGTDAGDGDDYTLPPGPGGDGDGDGDVPDAGDGGDGDGCQTQAPGHARLVPEVLIVLDRSGSMDTGGNNRWTPSVNAIKKVTQDLGNKIEFGLMVFPGGTQPTQQEDCAKYPITDPKFWECQANNGSWGNADQCQVGSLAVDVGLNQSTAIAQALSVISPNGGTPTALTLVEAGKYLATLQAGPGTTPKPQYVLLVTDGEPNCGGDVDDTVTQIQKLAQDGIKTFVIGYEISGSTIAAMDRMAAAGDTGRTQHIAVQNEVTLSAALTQITGQLQSCNIALEQAVTQPEHLLVSIDGLHLTLNQADGNGFSVAAGGQVVTLHGSACELLRTPGTHQVSIQMLCQLPVSY